MDLKDKENSWANIHFMEYEKGKSIYTIKKEKLYHYTSLDTLEAILKFDQFRATQVRFSNDIEEYDAGKYLMKGFIDTSLQPKDYYMICFCQEADLLSQWREYARAGVSIELDFSKEAFFSLKGNQESFCAYAEPIEVIYANYDIDELEKGSIDTKGIAIKVNGIEQKLAIIENCKENYIKEKGETGYNLQNTVNAIIPYIKNAAFSEEKEVRIIFDLLENQKEIVQYMKDERVGFMRPYLNVQCGLSEELDNKVTKLMLDRRVDRELHEEIEQIAEEYGMEIEDLNDAYNKECIYIGAGNNQKDVFDKVNRHVENRKNTDIDYKIWCKGHWPIRTITIGPCANQSIVAESVAHYIKNIYWMKYVDVKCSKIPYREKHHD